MDTAGLRAYKLVTARMDSLLRILVIVMLLAIVGSLGSALYHLNRHTGSDSRRFARALTVRISLSVVLFLLLMLAWRFGLITPHGWGGPRP
jgi:hypothetical protein